MITSRRLSARGFSIRPGSILMIIVFAFMTLPCRVDGADSQVRAASRIDLSGAKRSARTRPAVELSSYAEPWPHEAPVVGTVFELACGCETVCDCPGSLEPACGLESSFGSVFHETGCGVEFCDSCDGFGCDSMDPSCGGGLCDVGVHGFLDSLFPRLKIRWERYDFFAGVAGFTGPMNFANVSDTGTDRQGAGSFGFYEGYNRGFDLGLFGTDLAYQSGLRFTQNNLSGAGFTDESRQQVFLTSGFFRKVDYGLQFGLVLDYQYEDWYFRSDLIQLRGELSWVTRQQHVWGLKFAAGVDDDTALTSVMNAAGQTIRNDIALEATTQYRLFHRQHLTGGGLFEGFAGWTENEDGLLGVELDLPIHPKLAWNTSATYLIPSEGTAQAGHTQEAWNLMIGITYRPGGLRCGSRYSRPLFKVADNGSFLVDRR